MPLFAFAGRAYNGSSLAFREVRTKLYHIYLKMVKITRNKKGATMEKIDKYLEEIEAAMCKMDPIEQDRLMEVIRISFPEYFDGNYMKS